MLTVTAAVLQSIAVTPANPSVAKGTTQQFTATGHLLRQLDAGPDQPGDLGLGHDLRRHHHQPRAWRRRSATGTSTISATLGGVTGSTVLTVTAAVLQSIAVTPANPSIAKGATQQFTATGTYSDNSTQNLTSQVTWASATTSVATITAAGLATAVATGHLHASAPRSAAISGSTVLTVSAAVLQSIAVTPANPSIAKGPTEQFTATGTYSDNSTQDLTSQVTWASSHYLRRHHLQRRSQGLAIGRGHGTSTISAMLDGVAGSTVLTVTAAALESISVTPANPSIPVGEVQPFTATGTYSDNSTQDLTSQVTWASATTSVATITSGGLASAFGDRHLHHQRHARRCKRLDGADRAHPSSSR